jgi:hypothetical protein
MAVAALLCGTLAGIAGCSEPSEFEWFASQSIAEAHSLDAKNVHVRVYGTMAVVVSERQHPAARMTDARSHSRSRERWLS